MGPRPIMHIEIPTADRASTARFYAELFDWRTPDPAASYATFTTGNLPGGFPALGGGLRAVTDQLRAGDVVPYVPSTDLAGDLARAESLGGRVLLGPTPVGGDDRVALVADPNGARLALVERAG